MKKIFSSLLTLDLCEILFLCFWCVGGCGYFWVVCGGGWGCRIWVFLFPWQMGCQPLPPGRRSRVLGQEIRVTQHPWVLGALLETLLGTGLVLGVRLVLGTRQAVTL